MEAGGVGEAAGQRLGQHRDRAAHEDRGGSQEQCRQEDVEGEADARRRVGDAEGELLDELEQQREEQGVDADAALDEAVGEEQPRRPARRLGPRHQRLRHPAEEDVADGEARQEDAEHGGGRLAVGAEQRRQVLLPGDLVDEPRGAREHGEQQRGESHS